jgi:hypothetical protein
MATSHLSFSRFLIEQVGDGPYLALIFGATSTLFRDVLKHCQNIATTLPYKKNPIFFALIPLYK